MLTVRAVQIKKRDKMVVYRLCSSGFITRYTVYKSKEVFFVRVTCTVECTFPEEVPVTSFSCIMYEPLCGFSCVWIGNVHFL